MPIQGTVTNTNGEPVAGVTIQVKNGKLSAVTNSEGKFTIEAQKGETLVFTSIGYVSREISLNGQRQIDIILQNSITRMNEVVVTALGIEKTNKSFTLYCSTDFWL
ncbi:MAG: carboxypeptidase-like regulatory domain-containing protein [Chitinophagales bacterium]|nr:carboxypeptidase-like regulatory domain-containing protein [Chitinophagales bacterium]